MELLTDYCEMLAKHYSHLLWTQVLSYFTVIKLILNHCTNRLSLQLLQQDDVDEKLTLHLACLALILLCFLCQVEVMAGLR